MATEAIDFSGLEATPTETPSQEVTFEQPEAGEQPTGQESTPDGQQPEAQIDGRRGPANIRHSIKAASEALPDQAAHFKELGNAYFREQAYRQAFAKPEEAVAAKQLIEGVGGVEGITTLQQRLQGAEQQDLMLKEGNPELLDQIFKDFPEGAVSLAGPYLERLNRVTPEAFKNLVAPHAVDMLKEANILGALSDAYNSADPKKGIEQLYQWAKRQIDAREQSRTAQSQKNPAEDRLKQRETELNEREEKQFSQGVAAKVDAAVVPEINKTVDQYAKSYKLNDTQRVHFQNTLQARIVQEMNADKTYEQQVNLRKSNQSRTHDSVASYISGEFNRRLKDAAFKVAQEIYGAPRVKASPDIGVPKPSQPKTAPGGGPLVVSAQPANSEIDWNRKDAELLFIKDQAYLKDGRLITWRKPNA